VPLGAAQAVFLGFEAKEATAWPEFFCRLRASAMMALRSYLNFPAFSSRTCRTWFTISSFIINSLSHQFFRSANDRALKASLPARRFDGCGHFGVGDMRAIPRQQKVHTMDGRNGDMT
jgi:hypothetical protein